MTATPKGPAGPRCVAELVEATAVRGPRRIGWTEYLAARALYAGGPWHVSIGPVEFFEIGEPLCGSVRRYFVRLGGVTLEIRERQGLTYPEAARRGFDFLDGERGGGRLPVPVPDLAP